MAGFFHTENHGHLCGENPALYVRISVTCMIIVSSEIVELSVIAICTSNCNTVPKNIRINILYDITSLSWLVILVYDNVIEYSTFGSFWRHANVVVIPRPVCNCYWPWPHSLIFFSALISLIHSYSYLLYSILIGPIVISWRRPRRLGPCF